MADYRNVLALIIAVGLAQLGGGLLGVLAPLGLGELGLDAFAVGLVGAVHAAGFMAGAWTAPRALTMFGNIRVISAAAALTAVSALAMDLALNVWAWTAFRIVQGAGFALIFASAEAWMSEDAPERSRGGVLSFYFLVGKVALLVGPFFALGAAPLDARSFIWCGIFLTGALVPVCLTRKSQPHAPDAEPLPLSALWTLAPSAVIGVFAAGVVNSGTLALLPVYAAEIELGGSALGAAAIAMAAAWVGGIVSQWPAGRISDAIDRRYVVAALAAIAAAAAFALAIVGGRAGDWVALALLALWGVGSLSFYGVAVAHGVDWAKPRQIPRVMAGLLFVWAAGSVLGPPLSGLAMRTPFGPGGLFVLAGVMLTALTAAMLIRRQARENAPQEMQEPWEPAQPTSLAGADFDPRGEDSAPGAAPA